MYVGYNIAENSEGNDMITFIQTLCREVLLIEKEIGYQSLGHTELVNEKKDSWGLSLLTLPITMARET